MKEKSTIFAFLLMLLSTSAIAQQSDVGAWYMFFGNLKKKESQFSLHAEAQYRNHNFGGDLEQLLLRSGLQYTLKDNSATLTVGYGYILSQAEGEVNNSVAENRIYQEAFLRQKVGGVQVFHRFRYEQRFIEGQDFRTRYRYNIFVNVPINKKDFSQGTFYAAFYNEIFVNGQKREGVEFFDRNRLYGAAGYKLSDNTAVQLGYMSQMLNHRSKPQLQLSLHHNLKL